MKILYGPFSYSLALAIIYLIYCYHFKYKGDKDRISKMRTVEIQYSVIIIILAWSFFPNIGSKVYPVYRIGHALSPRYFYVYQVIEIKTVDNGLLYGKALIEVNNYFSYGENRECPLYLLDVELNGRIHAPLARELDEYYCLYDVDTTVEGIQLEGIDIEYVRLLDEHLSGFKYNPKEGN